jgi:hypothetical protein
VSLKDVDLKMATHTLEDAIITLSGPALAISGILAGVDLLTGGHVMVGLPWLTFAWAITLMLTLDFQVLTLGVRAKRIYLSDKSRKRKFAEIVLACLIAASIAFVSVQMQSIIARSNGVGISVEQATVQLGISPLALIWERSALVLFLIFLAGWFREGEQEKQESETVPLRDETVQLILSKLAKLDQLEQAIAQQSILVTEEEDQPAMPLLVGEHQGEQEASNSERIRALLAENADLTDRELAEIVRCSVSTANKWKRRIGQESEAN